MTRLKHTRQDTMIDPHRGNATIMRMIALLLAISTILFGLVGCSSSDGDNTSESETEAPSAEYLIRQRIKTFVTAYNDGDMTAAIACFDAKTKNQLEAAINLIEALTGKLAGFKIAMSDLFSLGVGLEDDAYMKLKITDVQMTGDTSAVATATMELTGSRTQTTYFVMTYEHNGWYIHDMTDNLYTSTDRTDTTERETAERETATSETATASTEGKIAIDPFTGIQCVVTGISPYCQLSVNEQNCDENAQQYVTYSLDKETYANGDTAIITATLNQRVTSKYTLTETEYSFLVQGQAEYITSLDGLDLSFLQTELQDYIDSQCSAAIDDNELFGRWVGRWIAEAKTSLEGTYLSSLKLIRKDSMGRNTPYNRLSFIYKADITSTDENDENLRLHFCLSAVNIIKYPDGRIGWGTSSPEAYDFVADAFFDSIEQCIASSITAHKSDYNISLIQ